MAWSVTSFFARVRKASRVTLPSSPLARVRTLTAVGGGFLVAEDEDEGDFLQAEVADLGVHLFVARSSSTRRPAASRLLCTCFGVVVVLFADGDEADLDGGEPEGEGAGVVLDEDAEEAFDGAEERAVDHDGLVALRRLRRCIRARSGRGG